MRWIIFLCAFAVFGASNAALGSGLEKFEGNFPLQGIIEVDTLQFEKRLRKMVSQPDERSLSVVWPAYGEFLLIRRTRTKEETFEWLMALRAVAPTTTARNAVDGLRVEHLAEQDPTAAIALMEQLPPEHPARSYLSYSIAQNLRALDPQKAMVLAQGVQKSSFRYAESQLLVAELKLDIEPHITIQILSRLSPEWFTAPNRAHRLALMGRALHRLGVSTGAQILFGTLYEHYPRYRKLRSLKPLLQQYGIPSRLHTVLNVIDSHSGRRRKNAMKKLEAKWRNNRNSRAAVAYGYGLIYFKQRDWDRAGERFLRANSLASEPHLRYSIATSMSRWANKKDSYTEILQWYTAAHNVALTGCKIGCEFADALLVPALGMARVRALEATGFHDRLDEIYRDMAPYLQGLRLHPEILIQLGIFAYEHKDFKGATRYFQEILTDYETSPGKDRLPWGIRAHHWLAHLAALAGKGDEKRKHEDLLKRRWPLSNEADQLSEPSSPLSPVDWRRTPPPLPEDTSNMREIRHLIITGQLPLALRAMQALLRRGIATPGLVAALAHTYLSLERPSQARHLINQFGGMLGSASSESAAYLPLAYPIQFLEEVRHAAKTAGIAPEFLAAVVRHESNFNPKIKSWAGAIGLTQLMPRTARAIAARHMPELRRVTHRLRDPELNLQVGAYFLSDLLKRYKGDEVKVLVAYNAGSGALHESLKSAPSLPDEVQMDAIRLRSAVAYARRVLHARNIYRRIFGDGLHRSERAHLSP